MRKHIKPKGNKTKEDTSALKVCPKCGYSMMLYLYRGYRECTNCKNKEKING